MKSRLSYGTVGNAEIGDYASAGTLRINAFLLARYDDDRYVEVWQIRLRWENPDNLAGIDLGFL